MMARPEAPVLAVGDPVRRRIGAAAVAALWTGAAFIAYLWVAKEVRPLYAHEPWRDDPYDTVVSFAFFFVPILAGLSLVRAALCRRARPLPVRRAHELLVAVRLMLAIAAATLVAEWASVALGVQRTSWNSTTVAVIGVLALLTLAVLGAGGLVLGALRFVPAVDTGPDWWSDATTAVDEYLPRDGAFSRGARRTADAVVLGAGRATRRSPIAMAAMVAILFGIMLASTQAITEGGFAASVFLLYISVAAASMFSFLLVVGRHLRLVRANAPMDGQARRITDSVAVASAAFVAALALRGDLRPVAAMIPGKGPGHELGTFTIVALAVGALVFVTETGLRLHRAE